MRTVSLFLLLFTSLFVSCTSSVDQNAKSVNVDSSNVSGAAPVEYGPDDPKDTMRGPDPTDDTGRRANTSGKEEKEVR